MLSPQLRSKIDGLWSTLWSAGMTNPLTAIEQITYLLFLQRLEALDADRVATGKRSFYAPRVLPDGQKCELPHHEIDGADLNASGCAGHSVARWSQIEIAVQGNEPHGLIADYVFPWLRELERIIQETDSGAANGLAHSAGRMEDAFFQLPRSKPKVIRGAVEDINDLFRHTSASGASGDVMGDIFEYLLSEIQSSGKNGQFRTPRHLIRFMVEMLDPDPGEAICDPAAGTGGFLVNALLHLRQKATAPEDLRLEWDGTPHRASGNLDPSLYDKVKAEHFVGFDNDRTMVRIGWMNLVLHGITDPAFERTDTLSQSFKTEGAFRYVLANPPFTGSVDEGDLNPNRPWKQGGSKPLTTKSELLFVWLILDLLEPGGRAAVIVPEGVLFGSTKAHRRLRQQLLLDHRVEAVASLPAGVFQPYTGVKTSILVFQKVTPSGETRKPHDPPKTERVWFYEVEEDGFSLDAKRTAQPTGDNDLVDALAKWTQEPLPAEDDEAAFEYHQPEVWKERWRIYDERALRVYGDVKLSRGEAWGIHELDQTLAPEEGRPTPASYVSGVEDQLHELLRSVGRGLIASGAEAAREAADKKKTPSTRERAVRDAIDARRKVRRQLYRDAINDKTLLEQDDRHQPHARRLFERVWRELADDRDAWTETLVGRVLSGDDLSDLGTISDDDAAEVMTQAARLAARIDGFDLYLRSPDTSVVRTLDRSKCWTAPVRVLAEDPDWEDAEGTRVGSHDGGVSRPEYEASLTPDRNGGLDEELLDPDCIEANAYNLTAGRYKPFHLDVADLAPPAEIIRELQTLGKEVERGLAELLEMVNG